MLSLVTLVILCLPSLLGQAWAGGQLGQSPASCGARQMANLSLSPHHLSRPESDSKECPTLLRRREWRTLDDKEKGAYISAVKCLQSLPARNPAIKEARTRFDEFQALHIYDANRIHGVGHFLPWHRRFISLYETALRDECGYAGAHPFWDWTQDVMAGTSLPKSPVFDGTTGFGGNGVPGTFTLPQNINSSSRINPLAFIGCVQDGPFANYTLHLGPGKLVTDHCLTRNFNETNSRCITSEAVARCTRLSTYEEFRIELEGLPLTNGHRMHDGGHVAVGGEMTNFFSSPGDPLFYLHHANLDRIWWQWQQARPERLHDMSGRSTVQPPYVNNVTLAFPLDVGSLGETVIIRDIMDIHSAPSCFTYI